MIWGIFAVQKAIQDLIQTPIQLRGIANTWTSQALVNLEGDLEAYLHFLTETAITVFYAGNGLIRSVTNIYDITAPPIRANYWMACDPATQGCYLDDPYEGELFAVFIYLYSQWNNQTERDMIWVQKRAMLQAANFTTANGQTITVQKGFWFSSHEQWKYLELPYQSASAVNNRVFRNGERARTAYSNIQGIAGMHASVTDVVTVPGELPSSYISATGIQEIAFQQITDNQIVTPYAAFPTMLADLPVGLAWYLQMLQGPKMQNPFGSTESISVDASAISPVLTWDSKITSLCAMLGGVSNLVERGMMRDRVLSQFSSVIDREWLRVFPVLRGQDQPIESPQHAFPSSQLGSFSSCLQ